MNDVVYNPIKLDPSYIKKPADEVRRALIEAAQAASGAVPAYMRGQWGVTVSLTAREAVRETIERALLEGALRPEDKILGGVLPLEDFVLEGEDADLALEEDEDAVLVIEDVALDVEAATWAVLEAAAPEAAEVCRLVDEAAAYLEAAQSYGRAAWEAAQTPGVWGIYKNKKYSQAERVAFDLERDTRNALYERAERLYERWGITPNPDISTIGVQWWEGIREYDRAWPSGPCPIETDLLFTNDVLRQKALDIVIEALKDAPPDRMEAAIVAASKALGLRI